LSTCEMLNIHRIVLNLNSIKIQGSPHSTRKCNSGDFGRGFVAQAFPGSVVDP